MTHSATGIWDVASVARDYVEMELRHGLARRRTVVEAKIEGIRRR